MNEQYNSSSKTDNCAVGKSKTNYLTFLFPVYFIIPDSRIAMPYPPPPLAEDSSMSAGQLAILETCLTPSHVLPPPTLAGMFAPGRGSASMALTSNLAVEIARSESNSGK